MFWLAPQSSLAQQRVSWPRLHIKFCIAGLGSKDIWELSEEIGQSDVHIILCRNPSFSAVILHSGPFPAAPPAKWRASRNKSSVLLWASQIPTLAVEVAAQLL